MKRSTLVAGLCSLAAVACGFWGQSERPGGVPSGAVEVTFSKDGGWAYCWLDAEINLNRCRTYNWRGDRLHRPFHEGDPDDVFVRYRGDGPVPEAELQIDTMRTQVDFVWLRNGVVLLPRNDFENQKTLVDKLVAQ